MYKSIVSFAALGWLSLVRAQVPSDLSSAFDPSSIILQVSYTGQSDNGFKDGSQFTADRKFLHYPRIQSPLSKLTGVKKPQRRRHLLWEIPLESTLP